MLTHTTLLISKMDPIKYIFEKLALSGRIARWKIILTEYDIQYTSQKAIKGSVVADHLAHQAVDDYQSMQFECTWRWHWRYHYIPYSRTSAFHRQIMF